MFTLRHLKTLQHVSIIIQTIFMELVCSVLKSLILKFVKNVNGLQSSIPLHTERTHTHQMLCCRITTLTFYIFNKF